MGKSTQPALAFDSVRAIRFYESDAELNWMGRLMG